MKLRMLALALCATAAATSPLRKLEIASSRTPVTRTCRSSPRRRRSARRGKGRGLHEREASAACQCEMHRAVECERLISASVASSANDPSPQADGGLSLGQTAVWADAAVSSRRGRANSGPASSDPASFSVGHDEHHSERRLQIGASPNRSGARRLTQAAGCSHENMLVNAFPKNSFSHEIFDGTIGSVAGNGGTDKAGPFDVVQRVDRCCVDVDGLRRRSRHNLARGLRRDQIRTLRCRGAGFSIGDERPCGHVRRRLWRRCAGLSCRLTVSRNACRLTVSHNAGCPG